VRKLIGAVPRAYRDHRTRLARTYAEACREKLEDFNGRLPKSGRRLLREYGRICVELDRLQVELDRAFARRRLTVAKGIRRERKVLHFQLLAYDRRLHELAGLAQAAADPFHALLLEEEAKA